ncbi:transcriptional regulator [Kitasatospora sp. NPDC090091]|uniref:transcriptional regulator n=1 Tax=Kitasatospora sp. NPDC090091 TaxID=3364081 RepID=UPI00380A73C3
MSGMFAAVFIALFAAHQVGDHWVQTGCQAATKGLPGRPGRWACTKHVATLTATKAVLLALAAAVLDLHLTAAGLAIGLGVDAASHWWADRRTTLAALARAVDKTEFYDLGTPAHPNHPVTADGSYAPTLGTGAYSLDQSFHILWLFTAALIITAV